MTRQNLETMWTQLNIDGKMEWFEGKWKTTAGVELKSEIF